MKRSGFASRGAPMKQSSFKPSAERKPMKSRGPKMTPTRKSAKGEACTLRFPCCNFDPATMVWCHSNRAEDGKGAGMKARDEEGCYGCHACHAWLDGGYANKMPRTLVDTYFDLARAESQKILKKKGLIP
jgi:hypothetical protein